MIQRAVVALLLSFAGHAVAEGITLQPPIDCDLSKICYIQQYVDRDPSESFTDYQCAGQSYNGHKGTDFAIPSIADIENGIAVLAAADGIVEGIRDGMADIKYTDDIANQVKGRECGNGVQINHGHGWVTQYCHLKQGSVSVKTGQSIAVGDQIGEVGISGRAAFPHVHLSVRKDGEVVDPFNPNNALTCPPPSDSTLWADPPPYRPGGLIAIGFADHVPDYATIKAGTAAMSNISSDAPGLVIFGFGFGIRAGDIMRLSILGPNGQVIAEDIEFNKPQAQSYRAIGKKLRRGLWPAGDYTGTVSLIRKDNVVTESETILTIR